MSTNEDKYRFDLVLNGELVENSADAYDVANTIIALTTATREMVRVKYGDDIAQQVSINVNAFKEGSLKTQFLFILNEPIAQQVAILPALTTAYHAYKYGKDAIEMVKDYISVRKWLKGKKPEKIVASPGGDTYNIHLNNSTLTINKDSFKALQDKTIQKSIDKVVEPLDKAGSQLDTLSITTADSKSPIVVVHKSEAKFVRRGDEEFQTIDSLRLKGVITKIDTKVRSGYLNLGNMTSRRVSFTYPKKLPQEQFDIMILSLRTQVQIYLMGVVNMDMESKPQHVDINSIEDDEKLL